MKSRCIEDIVQPAKTHLHIAVSKYADECGDGAAPEENRHRRASDDEQRHSEEHALNGVHKMETACIEEPETNRAVMQGMEAPEQHPFVSQTMRPIKTELRDHQTKNHLSDYWPMPGPEACALQVFCALHDTDCGEGDDGHFHHDFGEQCVREIVRHLPVIFMPDFFMGTNALKYEQR